MKKLFALFIVLVVGCTAIPQPSFSQAEGAQYIRVLDLIKAAAVSPALAASSGIKNLGYGPGEAIQGFFSLCWDISSVLGNPDTKIVYKVAAREGETLSVPTQVDGTDISILIADTYTAGGDIGCVPSGDFTNEIGLFPWAEFYVQDAGSTPADTLVNSLWLIKY